MAQAAPTPGGITSGETAANEGWDDSLHALAQDQRATRLSPSPLRGEPRPEFAEGGRGEGPLLPQPPPKKHALGETSASTRPLSALSGTFSPEGRREDDVWVCAEKLPLWQAVHPMASLHPTIAAPAEYAAQAWTREDALRELVRGRLLGLGPVTVEALAAPLGVVPSDVEAALLRLQAEGYVIQGQFDPTAIATQWCERHLLARIHRYTLGRLRREIEPVSRRQLMRFLLDWQHASPATRWRGPDALPAVLAQLEGYEAAADATARRSRRCWYRQGYANLTAGRWPPRQLGHASAS